MIDNKYGLLAEQLLRLFSGGDSNDDTQWDLREIELLVSQAHSALVYTTYFQNIKEEDSHAVNSEHYLTFTALPLVFDSVRKESYVLLPEQYLSLPSNKGINQVTQTGKIGVLPILPLKPGMSTMLIGTRAEGMNGRYSYYPEGDRVYFKDPLDPKCSLPFTNVNVRLIRPSGKSLTLGQELAVMAEVTKIMAQRRPQDKVNDNNPTI